MSEGAERDTTASPLDAVAEAGAAWLRAETDEDAGAAQAAHEQLMLATNAAMKAGIPLRDITAAEGRGQDTVRKELRGDTLKKVERARRHLDDAKSAYDKAIERAVRLGLSTRDVAQAADTTHGTIRAITQRGATSAPPPATADAPPEDAAVAG